MLARYRNNYFIQFLWGFLAIYLLNISVDAPDAYPNYIPENLSYNEQESIVEIVVEKVLGYDNAIAETDDVDGENYNIKKDFKNFWVIQKYRIQILLQNDNYSNEPNHTNYLDSVYHTYIQINSPPPEV